MLFQREGQKNNIKILSLQLCIDWPNIYIKRIFTFVAQTIIFPAATLPWDKALKPKAWSFDLYTFLCLSLDPVLSVMFPASSIIVPRWRAVQMVDVVKIWIAETVRGGDLCWVETAVAECTGRTRPELHLTQEQSGPHFNSCRNLDKAITLQNLQSCCLGGTEAQMCQLKIEIYYVKFL